VYAALDAQSGSRSPLVVVERLPRGEAHPDPQLGEWARDAKRLGTLEHANVARVREVIVRSDEVLVVGEFLDGVLWSELGAVSPPPPLEVALRVFVDALSGLSAVHNLRDAKREPLKLFHGELTPGCVVACLDGVTRIIGTCRPRSSGPQHEHDGSAYLAPEILLGDRTAGARADVYSVGAMLWEALAGQPPFEGMTMAAIVTQVLSGRLPRPSMAQAPAWAAPLGDVAVKAMAADPQKRFASATAFAAELRRISGSKLAPPVRIAALVRGTFGDCILLRREALERGEVPPPRDEVSGVEPASENDTIAIRLTPSTAPTPMPPIKHPPEEDDLPHDAVKPPPLPSIRPRLPTLSGVAPPSTTDPRPVSSGAPVVVAPPTPMVAFVVPTAAIELDASARSADAEDDEAPTLRPPSSATEDAPAAASSGPFALPHARTAPSEVVAVDVTFDEAPLAPRSRRPLVLALLAGPLAFAVAAGVWGAMVARHSRVVAAPRAPAAPTSAAAPVAPSASEPTPVEAPTPSASASAPVASEPDPSAMASASSEPTPPPAPPPVGETASALPAPPAPVSPAPRPPAPPRVTPPARTPDKGRYEPEGL
jgi:serine/threonine-protein kinase